MTKTAWFCPNCKKYHAPHVDTCPAPNNAFPGSIKIAPITPYEDDNLPKKNICRVCGMDINGLTGYVCGNVNCPTCIMWNNNAPSYTFGTVFLND